MRTTLLVPLAACSTAFAANHYTDRMFRRALDEQSTSPFYVLFTLNDPVTHTRRDVATTPRIATPQRTFYLSEVFLSAWMILAACCTRRNEA